MNQLDKLIKHIALADKGITPVDKIKLRFHKETKPYGRTRTIFAVDVFELEDHRLGMVISATKTTPSGRPSGTPQRAFVSAPELDPENGSLSVPTGLERSHDTFYVSARGVLSEILGDQPPSPMALISTLQHMSVAGLVTSLAIPSQGLENWLNPSMLKSIQEDWDDLRQEAVAELMWMLMTGAV
jgi:hypothetical protein